MRAGGKRCVIAVRRSRFAGKGSLSLGGEEPFLRELLLQALERREVLAEPEALDRKRAEAEVAACLEELRPTEEQTGDALEDAL